MCSCFMNTQNKKRAETLQHDFHHASRVCFGFGLSRLGVLPFLKDISLDVEHGKLITIIGKVGCGKSALLKAMLEMNILSESQSTAYIAQEPFIMNASVKENILMDLFTKNLREKPKLLSVEYFLPLGMLKQMQEWMELTITLILPTLKI